MTERDWLKPIQIVRKHRRHVEQSPGVGADAQTYALAVCDDILSDLASLSGSQGQWQDISTAKANCVVEQDYLVGSAKDGVWVATWRIGSAYPDGDFFPVTGYWSSNDDPTHWMYLPAPPIGH